MSGTFLSAVFAAVLPAQYLDSVGLAAYWFRKDARGRGDRISEQAKPKRFPAFALAEDTFLVGDRFVRTQHLDRVELWFGGKRYPATEVARTVDPCTVTLKTAEKVSGVKPLEFSGDEPVERLTWKFEGDATLQVETGSVGTNDGVRTVAETGRRFRVGKPGSILFDGEGRPVGIDFGDRLEVTGERFAVVPPAKYRTLPVDSFEKAAAAVEVRMRGAVLPVTLHLEQVDKDVRRRSRWSSFDENSGTANELDAIGYVFGDRVLVVAKLDGDGIARLSKTEATLPDGSKTTLGFAGALAEWSALVFSLPKPASEKILPLAVYGDEPYALDGKYGWQVFPEREGAGIQVEARKGRFKGVEFLRGALFAAGFNLCGDFEDSRWEDREKPTVLINDSGEVTTIRLQRRFGERYGSYGETVAPETLRDMLAGKAFNPEFVPRGEEDRNRLVWLGVETVRLTDALAREKQAQSFLERYSRPPLVTEIYPGSPAERAGLRTGDVLLAYRRGTEQERRLSADSDSFGGDWNRYFEMGDLFSSFGLTATPWPNVESSLNQELTRLGAGAKVTLVYVRDGKRVETEVKLEAAPPHYRNAKKARNRTLGVSVKDMTFEVRRYFKFSDEDPGVVLAKIKPGSPAAVSGLKMYELVTEVNGEKVKDAKDFAAKIKGKRDLVFAVRRLAQTRMVKIHVEPEPAK